jgi:hypothetical protein
MSKIVKKQEQSLALAEMEAELQAEIKTDAVKFAQGAQRVSFKGARITVDGQRVKDDKLVVACVDAVFSKAYYAGDFDDAHPQTPDCYAFHPSDQAAMVPHDAAPNKQAEKCAGCPHNRFGTAERGNGKRCKDEVRLMAVIPTGDDVQAAEVRQITIPPGSLGNWGKYVARLRDMGATFRSVLTEITLEPFKGAYKVLFHPAGKLPPEAYLALKGRRESVVEQAMQPYPVLEAEEAPAPAPQKRRNKKLE